MLPTGSSTVILLQMFDSIIAFSLRRRMVVLIGTLLLVAAGLFAFTKLPIDAVPDITNNQVQILTQAPALSPLEVEQFVTFPLEVALKSLPNLIEFRSASKQGLSVITIVFKDNVDTYFARQQVLERLREAEEHMPVGASRPELAPVSTGLGEIFRYVIRDTTGRMSAMDLRTIQDWIVRRQLVGTEGVAEVNTLGGELKQYQVLVEPDALISYNLTLRDVFEAVVRTSGNAGGAYIENGPEQYSIRSEGLARTEEDVRSTTIRSSASGTPVRVSDIATVVTAPALRFGAASQDGKGEVVTGIAMQLKGANSRVIVNAVKERIEEIKPSLPPGVVIDPYYDREELVDRTIHTVITNLIEGALLVIAVLLLFLANLRAGLLLASVIPLAMMFAAILMVLTGQSGNLMSLGAIDFGLVVDGSLIIIENCLRIISQRLKTAGVTEITPKELKKLVFAGAIEVRKAAQFGELIIIIVYLPILTLQGIEGKFFRPMALTVGYALLGALILSITYVPAMASIVLKRKGEIKESAIILWLHRIYRPILERVMNARKLVLGSTIILFLASVFAFTQIGGEFIPRLDEGDIALHIIRLPSISLNESQQLTTTAEKIVKQFKEVKTVVSSTGRAEISTDPMGVEVSDVFIMLHPRDEWESGRSKAELIEAMNERLEKIPGIGLQWLQPIEMRMNELIEGVRGDVAIKIFGEDFDVLGPAAQKIASILRKVEGGEDVAFEPLEGLPQLNIRPNRDNLSRYGLTVEDVNEIVSVAFGGRASGEVFEGEKRFDIVVKYAGMNQGDVDQIANILVPTPTGQRIRLGEIAEIHLESGPASVSREDGYRFTTVQSNVRGRDVESYVKEVQDRVRQEVKLPAGYNITYGGQFKNLQAASARLGFVVPIALALILILLYQTFKSLRLGLLIMLCVPMATIGGVAALLIGGLPFSISAGVGFIALFGVAVLNGIVMIAAIRKHLQEGKPRAEAIFAGAEERLRPVVTTAALAAFGFVPMLIASGAGAEVQRPLASVIIGGLITSTLLTLFVLPLVFDRFGGNVSSGDTEESADDLTANNARPLPRVAIILIALALSSATDLKAQTSTITLEEAVRLGQSYSATRRATSATVEEQRGLQSSSNVLPSLEVFYQAEEIPASGGFADGKTAIGLRQSMEFPLVYGARSRAGSLRVQEAEASVAEIDLVIRREIQNIYVDAVASRARLALSDTAVAIAQRVNRIAQVRREVGEITLLESSQMALALATEQHRRTLAEGEYRSRLTTLSRSIGIEDFEVPSDISSIDLNPTNASPDLSRHPSLLRAQLSVLAAEAEGSAVKYENYPGFGLEYRQEQVQGVTGFQGGELSIALPIFRWFNSGPSQTADARTKIAKANREAIEQQVSREVSALGAELTSFQQVAEQLEKDVLPQAAEVYRSATRLYEEGEITYIEVLTAQSTLLEARRSYLEALYHATRAGLELQLLIAP